VFIKFTSASEKKLKEPLKNGNFTFMSKKQKSKIGILGYGEVGQAIAKLYKNPKIKDLNKDDGLKGVDILHVCIPWDKDFINIVKKEIQKIKGILSLKNKYALMFGILIINMNESDQCIKTSIKPCWLNQTNNYFI